MAGKKDKASSVDTAVKSLIQDEVNKLADPEYGEEPFNLDPEESIRQLNGEDEDKKTVNRILSKFSSVDGFYGKLYYRASNGKVVFKHHIDMLEEIDDPELEILHLAKERGWDDGDYLLRVFKKGHPDCMETISWSIAASSKNSLPNNNESKNVKEKLSELSEILGAVKDISGSKDTVGAETTAKMLSEAFKSGIDTIKNNMSANPDGGLDKAIDMLSKLGMLKTSDKQPDFMNLMTQMLTVLNQMGVFGQQKKSDPFEDILKYRELGLLKFSHEDKEDPLSQIDKLKSLIEVVSTFSGAGGIGGEKPSIAVKLIETLGPKVPEIIEHITGSVNKVAEVSKMKLAQRLGAPLPPIAPIHESPDLIKEKSEVIDKGGAVVRHPLVQEIYNAVQNNDESYYGKLKDIINMYCGNSLEKILNSELSVPGFLQTLNTSLSDTFFTEEPTVLYFNRFIDWIKDEINKNLVIGVCDQCHEEYDYHSRQDYEQDSKICNCGGKILEQTNNKVGNA
jgi:hypothetical protein